MKIACSLVLILAFCAQADAQQVPVSTGTVTAAPAPKKRTPRKKAAPAPAVQKAAQKAPPVEEEEPGAVMIDPRPDEDRSGRFTGGGAGGEADTEEMIAPGGMPASYGPLKGSLSDAGRSLLVFENEEGDISFVQVFIGKSAVTWKLISTVRRGNAATAE